MVIYHQIHSSSGTRVLPYKIVYFKITFWIVFLHVYFASSFRYAWQFLKVQTNHANCLRKVRVILKWLTSSVILKSSESITRCFGHAFCDGRKRWKLFPLYILKEIYGKYFTDGKCLKVNSLSLSFPQFWHLSVLIINMANKLLITERIQFFCSGKNIYKINW